MVGVRMIAFAQGRAWMNTFTLMLAALVLIPFWPAVSDEMLEADKSKVRSLVEESIKQDYERMEAESAKNIKTKDAQATTKIPKFYKLSTEYDIHLFGNSASCEVKSRLFDAEIEFPPFDFLKMKTNPNALFDFDLMNSCLISNVR